MDNKRLKDNKKAGFTLIEVIVAAMILVVAAIPLLSSFVASTRMNVKGRQKEQAMTIAENLVESVKAIGAATTLEWVNGSATDFSLVNNSAEATESVGKYLVSQDAESKTVAFYDGTNVTIDDYLKYDFTVSNIYIGKTYYDAYVAVELDLSTSSNVKAYAYRDKYNEVGMNVMKYYVVKVEIFPAGSVTGAAKPTVDHLATYSGSFVTQN